MSYKHLISFDKEDINIADSKTEGFTCIGNINCTPDFEILYKLVLAQIAVTSTMDWVD